MTEQDRRFHTNAGKDGRLTVPAATRRALGWSPGSTVYITMDGQTLLITDKEQIGKQNHTLTIHRRGAIILTPFVLRQANIYGCGTYVLDARTSESNGVEVTSLQVSAK